MRTAVRAGPVSSVATATRWQRRDGQQVGDLGREVAGGGVLVQVVEELLGLHHGLRSRRRGRRSPKTVDNAEVAGQGRRSRARVPLGSLRGGARIGRGGQHPLPAAGVHPVRAPIDVIRWCTMRSPTWAAVWIWTRADLRRRWRSWAVLGLLGGVTLGLAAAGVAGARRTASSVPRAERAFNVADAGVLANNPSFDDRERAAVAALSYVTATYPFEVAFALQVPTSPALGDVTLIPTTDAATRNMIGDLVAGRFPDPARTDEVVVDQNARRRFHLDIGATMTVAQSISPEDAGSFPPGLIPKNVDLNFTQQLRVVGIQKSLSSDPGWIPSSGFYARYGTRMPGFVNEFVTMRGGQADLARLTADVSRIVGRPVNVESTQDLDGLRKAKDVTGVEREGLLLFALAVVLGGGVLVGQALVRAVTAGAAELPTWQAMGADSRDCRAGVGAARASHGGRCGGDVGRDRRRAFAPLPAGARAHLRPRCRRARRLARARDRRVRRS